MKGNLKKNFIWNSIGATINAASSLFFLIIVTRINGVDNAGIFTFAFSTACLLYIVGTYSGRTYQVTEPNKEITDSDYFYTRIFTSLMMIIFAIIFSIIKGYQIDKTVIIVTLVVYKSIESMFDVIYGLFQKNDELYKVGISLFVKAIVQVLSFVIINVITHDLLLSSLGLIISNLVIFIIYDLRNFKKYNFKFKKINYSHIKHILIFGFWTFLFTFLTQYLLSAPKYAIDNLLSDEIQTIYGIISMPATIMVLSSQFLSQPFLSSMSSSIKEKKFDIFNSIIIKLIIALFIIGALFSLVAYIIGIPFLELIYSVKLEPYLWSLMLVIFGAIFFGVTSIISCGLITVRKTMGQSIIFIIVSIFAFLISNYFVKYDGVFGASLSYFLSMLLLMILYYIFYFFEYKKLKRG